MGFNILLGFLGMQLVQIDEPHAATTSSAEKEESVRDSLDEEDDPDYVPEQRDSDDSLEYRSDTEATQESQDDDLLIVAELEDCPTTPNCEKVEHKIVKDLGKEASSEESEGSEESDPEIEEVQEVGSECNTPACEKPKHQVSEVEVVVKVLDNELEEEMEKVEVADIELEDNPEEVEVAELEDCPTTPNCEKVEHKIVKDVAEDKGDGSSSSSDDDLN